MNILFFGSTTDSVIVLEKLRSSRIVGIVTQPPRPIGRDRIVTPTPVEVWGKAHNITVLSFESNPDKPWLYKDEQQVIDTLQSIQADILISASYGQKIPWQTIQKAPLGGINVHPSILPRWRGADPVPWAILSGDHQIGVTVVTLSETFDAGLILAQKKIPIKPTDTSLPLRTHLFKIGAELLVASLDHLDLRGESLPAQAGLQGGKAEPYARRLTRQDGFEPWMKIIDPLESERIKRKFRAFHPWPGIWSTFQEKRIKILGFSHEPTIVQFEGKKPIGWKQSRTPRQSQRGMS